MCKDMFTQKIRFNIALTPLKCHPTPYSQKSIIYNLIKTKLKVQKFENNYYLPTSELIPRALVIKKGD